LPVEKTDGFLINATAEIKQKIATALPGTTFCDCEYTRWGFWSMASKQTVDAGTFDDHGSMNLWVAGRRPNETDVPTVGSATYNGHIIANVNDGSSTRLATGGFQNTVNFGSGNIDSTASLDGASFSGNLNISNLDRRNFGGSMGGGLSSDPSLGRTMNMNGSFFVGKTSPVGEMGGSVAVTGPGGYIAGGIFAGKKN